MDHSNPKPQQDFMHLFVHVFFLKFYNIKPYKNKKKNVLPRVYVFVLKHNTPFTR